MSSGDRAPAQSPPQDPHRRQLTLAVLALAQFTATLEFSVAFVALPDIDRDLQLGALLQWVPSTYAVMLAGFLVIAGWLADRRGHRRMFLTAVAGFALTSGIAAGAPGAATLLLGRGGQGLAVALLQPAGLGLLQASFPAGPARARAIAIWSSVGAAGLAAGSLLGGALTTVSWRLTFAINVPLMTLCGLGVLLARPPSSQPSLPGRRRPPVLAGCWAPPPPRPRSSRSPWPPDRAGPPRRP